MNSNNIFILLNKLNFSKVKQGSKWVTCRCPFAQTRHQGGNDEHPSFGISIGYNSRFVCQACGAKGSLLGLVWYLSLQTPSKEEYWSKVFRWCLENDASLTAMNFETKEEEEEKPFASAAYKGWSAPEVLGAWVEQFVPATIEAPSIEPATGQVLAYLRGPDRGLRQDTIDAWEIAWNPAAERIYIPMRDWKGRLIGYSGRAFGPKKPKFLHNTGFKRDYFLFGEHKIPSRGGVGYVVEGHFDVIGLWQNGIRSPVALMGTYPSKYQIEKLKYFFSRVVAMGDGDKAGDDLNQRVLHALSPHMPVSIEKLPQGTDPDQLTFDQILDLKAKYALTKANS